MTSLKKSIDRRVGSLFAVAALVLATVTPGLVPAFASAAQVTERSIALSSSSAQADDVTYSVTFKPVSNAGAYAIEFCSDSPLVNTACTAPAGLSVASPTTATAGFTVAETTFGAANDHNALAVTGTLTAGVSQTVDIAGIDNPDNAGTVYARIVTYGAEAGALAYQSETLGASIDDGGAAFSITDTVGVSAAVKETMTFCVAGNVINQGNCATTDNGGVLKAPTVKLGEGNAHNLALDSNHVCEGSIYSQISTNAASGAVVSLKVANNCGGLKRLSATACDIAPALAAGIQNGDALFGVKVASATDPLTGTPNGTYRAYNNAAYYNDSVFKMNFVDGTNGVTSTYGDRLLDTADLPVNNKNVQITFGASVSNQTPAGLYSADLSLIATGKF
jgi:hypothetical protein